MFVKRYLVDDMQEAMSKIRKELGDDAMILNSRFVRQKGVANLFKKKRLEVVAAYDSKIKKKRSSLEEIADPSQHSFGTVTDNEKIEELNDKIDELQKAIGKIADNFSVEKKSEDEKYSYEVNSLYKRMINQDVDADIANELAKEVEKIISKMEVEPSQMMEQLIAKKIGEAEPIKIKKYKRNIVVLLGPTGVGKTTTLVKLAGHYVCEEGLKVGIINTDTFRVAAKEQLKIYSEILQIPLNTAYTPDELKEALKKQEDRDLIFMDTAGRSFSDQRYKKDFENIIKMCEPDEIFVVLSLTTGFRTCKKILDNFSFLDDYKLILTKLDEANAWGNILNFSDYTSKKLSYITNGQNIPDDIEQAETSKIASNILKQGGIL